MGSPGSQAPAIATSVGTGIRNGRRGHTGSLLLRLLVVVFVLNACHVPLTNAKVSFPGGITTTISDMCEIGELVASVSISLSPALH